MKGTHYCVNAAASAHTARLLADEIATVGEVVGAMNDAGGTLVENGGCFAKATANYSRSAAAIREAGGLWNEWTAMTCRSGG
jgi:hypothetical protein